MNKISFIIPVFNEVKTVKQAIQEVVELNYENKETALKGLQQNIPESFENILELISLVYYSNDKVLDRINWKRKTLQPNGWEVEKFDPEVLETTKLRKPFWKEV